MRLRLALAFVAGVLCACGGSSGAGLSPAPTPTPTLVRPSPVGLETPAGNAIYLGAFANVTHAASDITTLEAKIGRTLALDMHYDTWTSPFPAALESADNAAGRLPVDSWDCGYTDAQIASGVADATIETRAIAVANYAHPVFVRFFWDMNTPSSYLTRTAACYDAATDNADGTFSATEYVAAWRHIRAIFTRENVTNAIWVWSPSAAGSDASAYYPGADVVDWIGVDAYDTTGAGFTPTFAAIYPSLAQYGKPIVIAETGELPAQQPAFFGAASASLQTNFPQIKGLIYYDSNSSAQDWRLTAAGISAFAALGADPYLSASAP